MDSLLLGHWRSPINHWIVREFPERKCMLTKKSYRSTMLFHFSVDYVNFTQKWWLLTNPLVGLWNRDLGFWTTGVLRRVQGMCSWEGGCLPGCRKTEVKARGDCYSRNRVATNSLFTLCILHWILVGTILVLIKILFTLWVFFFSHILNKYSCQEVMISNLFWAN